MQVSQLHKCYVHIKPRVFNMSTLWVILCGLPEKGRKEIEEIVEEIKERDREERGK